MPRPLLQILLALALVLAANHFWDPRPARVPDADTSARQGALPRTYIENARTWSFDEQGFLSDIVEAERVEQFPQYQRSRITAPRFYSHSENDKTWSANAEHGVFFDRRETLVLRRNVVLRHDQTDTRMETGELSIDLAARTAESTKKVTLTRDGNRTTADGLLANLDLETLELKPNVESIYAAQPQPNRP